MQEEEHKEKIDGIKEEDIQIGQSPFFQSKTFITILYAVGVILLSLGAFKAGEIVESQKASFAYSWSQNYYPNFVGAPPFAGNDAGGGGFMAAHGIFGPIISINSPSIVVQDMDGNVEKDVITSTNTVIRDLNNNIQFGDLKVNERIVVIGSPDNSGQIQARLIRIIPAPSSLPSSPNEMPPQNQ